MPDETYGPKVYQTEGGDKQVVASGGTVDIETGGVLKIGGVQVTTSAAELNKLDGVTADTAELNILDGVTASAAELNKMDGLTATPAELNELDGAALNASATPGTDAGTTVNVAIQLKDGDGADLAERAGIFAYLSDDANGDSLAGTAPSGGWAIGTDGLLIPVVAGKAAWLVCEADGDIDITITEAAAATWYLILVLPTGELVPSAVITFAE